MIEKCKWCGADAIHTEEIIHGTISHVIRCTNPKCGCALAKRDKNLVHEHWNNSHGKKQPHLHKGEKHEHPS